MEIEQLHLNLLDLRQLYCFMQNYFSDQQNPRVEILGDRARLLFKSLLDDATAQVFMAYSKIVESPSPCLSETENGVPKPKLVFEAPPRIVPTQKQNKSTPRMAANSELSTNPEKMKQCRNCARKDTMKQKTSAQNNHDGSDEQQYELKHFHDEDEQRKHTREPPENMGTAVSSTANSFVSCSSTSRERTADDLHRRREKKRPDTAVDYSEDICCTVKKIEAHIRAIKLRSRSRNHLLESGRGRLSGANNSFPFKSLTKAIPKQELSLRNGFGESESVIRASQLHRSSGRIESLSQSANRASRPQFVHGFAVPLVPEDMGTKDLTRKTVGLHPSSNGSASGRSKGKEENRGKNTPRQIVIRPTLLDRTTTELMVLPTPVHNRTVGETKRNVRSGPVMSRKKIEKETEKSQSSSSASSSRNWSTIGSSSLSWTSQQSGARSSEYSSPRHFVGAINLQRKHKPDSHKGSEIVIGGLRRLKNKLGLILHHHHHHHHHHNGGDGRLTRADRRNSMWNHLGNLFHKTRPVKKYNDNNKSRVKKAANKDQVGHFHALAERFMRHVSKPRKSKPSKGKIRGLRKQKKRKLKWWKLPKKAKKFGYKKRRLKFI